MFLAVEVELPLVVRGMVVELVVIFCLSYHEYAVCSCHLSRESLFGVVKESMTYQFCVLICVLVVRIDLWL